VLDSTNRPKNPQRRLVRRRSTQAAPSNPKRVRREPGQTARPEVRPHPDSQQQTGLSKVDPRLQPRQLRPEGSARSGNASGSGQRSSSGNRPSQGPRSESARPNSAQQSQRRPSAAPARRGSKQSLMAVPSPTRSGQRFRPDAQRGSDTSRAAMPKKRTSPLVYLCRLLILGVGVGAIAGTAISISNPDLRQSAQTSSAATVTAEQSAVQPQPNQPPGTLSTITTVKMGREITDLIGKIMPLTQNLTDLGPGVFVMDLDNGDFFNFNGGTTFSAASMIKLPILVAFFQDVDAGKIKLDEMLSIQQADIAEGSGDMQFDPVGTQYSALETATYMIITSDNTATNMIIRRMGGIEVLNRRFQQWGMQQTVMRNLLPDLEGTNTDSPKELVSLLSLLNDGKLVTMKSRDRIFDIMRRTETNTLLPSVVAPGSTVAHKTGDIGSLVGDVGIVDLPTGRRYAIAAVVKRPHNDSRAQELIRQMAAVIYEHFGGEPVLVPSPIPPTVQPSPQQAMPGMAPMAPGVPGIPTAPGIPGVPGVPGVAPTPAMTMPQTAPAAPVPEAVAPPQPAMPEASPTPVPEAESAMPEAAPEEPTEASPEEATL
jgi:beta-lactamase class A